MRRYRFKRRAARGETEAGLFSFGLVILLLEGVAVTANLGAGPFIGTSIVGQISTGGPPPAEPVAAGCPWWNIVCQGSSLQQYVGYIASSIVYYATEVFAIFAIPADAIALIGLISIQNPLLGFANAILVIFILYGVLHSPT